MNICHLIGLKYDSKKDIKIDENIKLRCLSEIEKNIIKKNLYYRDQDFLDTLENFNMCAEIIGKDNFKADPAKTKEEISKILKNQSVYIYDLIQDLRRFIFAIWIFSGKAVTMGGILSYNEDNIYSFYGSLYPEMARGDFWDSSVNKLKKFSEFWSYFKRLWFDYFDPAIWFFQEAMLAKFMPNKILKLTISMDRILTPDGTVELTERFSTRAALLLGRDLENKIQIKYFFKSMYNKRSSIVHGNVKINSNVINNNEYKTYLSHCRKLLCVFIENNLDWKEKIKGVSLGEIEPGEKLLNLLDN